MNETEWRYLVLETLKEILTELKALRPEEEEEHECTYEYSLYGCPE